MSCVPPRTRRRLLARSRKRVEGEVPSAEGKIFHRASPPVGDDIRDILGASESGSGNDYGILIVPDRLSPLRSSDRSRRARIHARLLPPSEFSNDFATPPTHDPSDRVESALSEEIEWADLLEDERREVFSREAAAWFGRKTPFCSPRQLKILDKAREMCEEGGIGYKEWIGAQRWKYGNRLTITHLNAHNALEIYREWKEGRYLLPKYPGPGERRKWGERKER